MYGARVVVPPHIVCVAPETYRTLMGVQLLNPSETSRYGIQYVNVWSWDGTLELGDVVTIDASRQDFEGDEDHRDFADFVFVVKNTAADQPEGVPIHRRPDAVTQLRDRPILTRSDQEMKTLAEWLDVLYPGSEILDPDGWRHDNKSLGEPLTQSDFQQRYCRSTIRPAGGQNPAMQRGSHD